MEEYTRRRRGDECLQGRSEVVSLLERLFEVDDATRKRTNHRINEVRQCLQGPEGKERTSVRPILPNSTLDRLTWEDLYEVETKLTSTFGPNLDEFFMSSSTGSLPVTPSGCMTPRGMDRRRGINLSVIEESTPEKSELKKKVLAALNKTAEELFLAMQTAEMDLAAAPSSFFPYKPSKQARRKPENSAIEPRVAHKRSASSSLDPTHIRSTLRKLSIGDSKSLSSSASDGPQLKLMEKFYYIAGAPGLMALKFAVCDEAPQQEDGSANLSLTAFLNNTNSFASTVMSSMSLDMKAKEKAERKERLQTFLWRKPSLTDLLVSPSSPQSQSICMTDSIDSLSAPSSPLPSPSVRFSESPSGRESPTSFLQKEHRTPRRTKIASTLFRGSRKQSPAASESVVSSRSLSQPSIALLDPRYTTEEENPPLDTRIVLIPSFGFRLELGTPMTPEQKAEVSRVENLALQSQDDDVPYYKEFFVERNEAHANILGYDAALGPIAITSELRERDDNDRNLILIRTKKGTLRTSVPATPSAKETLKLLRAQEPAFANAKFCKIKDTALNNELLEMERKLIPKNYKIGLLYVKEGQTKENEMFANVDSSPAFEEFLQFLGNRVVLQGWKGFRGGLDVNRGSTGTHSVHTKFLHFEMMFHVSTLLPYNPGDEQQLERKRHLGNDIVVVVFVDGTTPFPPDLIKSEFNHTFAVVQPYTSSAQEDKGKTFYRIGFADKVGVRSYGPLLPDPPVFEKCESFRQWFLTKLVNAERAGLHAPGFKSKIQRTRMLLLKEMIDKYCKKDIMPHADSFSIG